MDEVGELDLGDRAQPVEGGADGDADDRGLGEWRIDDALFAELLKESLGGAEDTAFADVLTHDEDALVGLHHLAHTVAEGFDDRFLSH